MISFSIKSSHTWTLLDKTLVWNIGWNKMNPYLKGNEAIYNDSLLINVFCIDDKFCFFTYVPMLVEIWITHWGRVTHIGVSKLTIIGLGRLMAWPAPSGYLNQCYNIVFRPLRSKFQWNIKTKFIQFQLWKCIWKCDLENDDYVIKASILLSISFRDY